jgi:hypothetical protein
MNLCTERFDSLLRGLRLAVMAAMGCAGTLFAQSTLVTESPFAPAGAMAGVASAPAEAYELAGSSVQGGEISVCIFERQKKHSQWIPVGGDVDGVHVISFDVAHDVAVVTISGSRKELSMRKSVVASASPSPAVRTPVPIGGSPADMPIPIASAPNQTGPVAIQDQKEARMLVSDLLEIGVQQRKAYQDAKLKAAQGSPPSPGN